MIVGLDEIKELQKEKAELTQQRRNIEREIIALKQYLDERVFIEEEQWNSKTSLLHSNLKEILNDDSIMNLLKG